MNHFITPLLHHSIASSLATWTDVPRVYPLIGLAVGYALVMWANPIRLSLRDGLRCIGRFKRVWLTFALLGLGYSVFQFATFTPIQRESDLDFSQVTSLTSWHWPKLIEVWRETPLPALEGVAGLFDNATTTYPLSVIAAILLAFNWRGLHGALLRALWKRFGGWGVPLYLVASPSCPRSYPNVPPLPAAIWVRIWVRQRLNPRRGGRNRAVPSGVVGWAGRGSNPQPTD